ncbi:hypothetical protein GF312_10485 [Candidatus Poribacteria bacterium]|nr:hypothetical protein [Candidatus Poribacteria bacterium]
MLQNKDDKTVFHKYGGHYHLRISNIQDLKHLLTIPDGRWMATSCPLFGLTVDPAFLKFLDADGNNRIISEEIRIALRWLFKCLKPSETWLNHQSNLPINLINTDDPEGKALIESAKLVLKNIGLPDSFEISLAQVRDRQKIMAQADYNGDGVIPPEVVKDPSASLFVRDLLTAYGGALDASGLKGITEANLEQFKKDANAYIQWYNQGVIPEGESSTLNMPFGTETSNLYQIINSIRDKVELFFAQCSLVRFDPRMSDRMYPREEEIAKLDYMNRQAIIDHINVAPLAKANPEGILYLLNGINEFYRDRVKAFHDKLVKPIFGEEVNAISQEQWNHILSKFAHYEKWVNSKPAVPIETMGIEKIKAYLYAPHDAAIRSLIIEDKTVADEIQQLQNLEKLILYHQWLFVFVNNYVSFPHLFNTETQAMFEMGKLVLGGREYSFSVRVENRVAHSNLAKNSGIYLLYLQVTGFKTEDSFEIAVPVTRGNGKQFYVGKRGVFFTIMGRELDAQIVQIVENPISLLDSIKDPFRRLYALIGGRISQISSSIQKESEKAIITSPSDQQIIQRELQQAQQTTARSQEASEVGQQARTSETPRTEIQRSGTARDIMIGTGLLVAGLGTALKFIVDAAKQLTQPKTLQVLLIMVGVFIIIGVTASFISALLKLRQRDMGVLLQASGWSINGRMRLIRPMAKLFCRKTKIPKGSRKKHKELLVPLERLARKRMKRGES